MITESAVISPEPIKAYKSFIYLFRMWNMWDTKVNTLIPIPIGVTTGVLRPPTWTFAGHQSPSYQTYSDVKHTSRKPTIKSTILEGQMLDLIFTGYVSKQKMTLQKKKSLTFSNLAKSRHTSGIKSCASWDDFNAVLDRF